MISGVGGLYNAKAPAFPEPSPIPASDFDYYFSLMWSLQRQGSSSRKLLSE
jgi:hypothetical protein